MFDTIKGCNSKLARLNINNNQLNDECMNHLGEFVQENLHLEVLNLSSNLITDDGIEILTDHLIGNVKLNNLKLNYNKGITEKSTACLSQTIKKSHVINLETWSTSIPTDASKEFEKFLKIPIDEREIPLQSNTKSASKIS